mgnify:CR=1 FL=1
MDIDPYEKAAEEVLSLMGFVDRGEWFGHDTSLGKREDLIKEAAEIIKANLASDTMLATVDDVGTTVQVVRHDMDSEQWQAFLRL